MFDLFRSRAKAVRYLLGALLMLVAISMVVTLIPGFVGASYAPENIIAEIGDDVLTAREVQMIIQQQLRNKAFPREMAGVYVPMIINQMIAERAVAYQAVRMGFRVSEADVALAVESMMPQLYQNGKFVGRDVYAQILSQQMNMTIPEFEENVRKQILLTRLENFVLEGVAVGDREVEQEFRRRHEKIKVDYISISPADFRSKVTVSREEMLAHYNANKNSFQVGEKRDVGLIAVEEGAVAQNLQITDEELRRIYQSEPDRFRTPERVKVRHILLKTTEQSEEEKAKIKAKAEDLLKQLKNGADFAALAKAHSEDAGTKENGGDLGWITRGQTVENFEKTAFALKPNELSGVITTEYGYHILQVLEKEPARLRPFEEVKAELAEEQKKQRLYDRMQELADQARAELIKAPMQAEQIAARLGLKFVRIDKFTPGDPIPGLGTSPDLDEAIASLAKGGVTPVTQLGSNRLVVAAVTEVYPARPAEFAEVEDRIRETLISQKAQAMAEEKTKQLREMMKTAGNDLEKLARALGVTVKSSPEFGREGSVEGLGSPVYLEDAFKAPVGQVVGPINAMGQTLVVRVTGKVEADLSKLAAERAEIVTAIKRRKAQERKELFEDGILTKLIQEKKVKIYDRNIQRLAALYRS
jgi:peptidyl-prolyl cis-trans isomerase D